MVCRNYQEAEAVNRCTGYAEAFCANCLAADKALRYVIIGIFCFVIVMGPMAISKADEAKRNMAVNPKQAP